MLVDEGAKSVGVAGSSASVGVPALEAQRAEPQRTVSEVEAAVVQNVPKLSVDARLSEPYADAVRKMSVGDRQLRFGPIRPGDVALSFFVIAVLALMVGVGAAFMTPVLGVSFAIITFCGFSGAAAHAYLNPQASWIKQLNASEDDVRLTQMALAEGGIERLVKLARDSKPKKAKRARKRRKGKPRKRR